MHWGETLDMLGFNVCGWDLVSCDTISGENSGEEGQGELGQKSLLLDALPLCYCIRRSYTSQRFQLSELSDAVF